MGGVSYLGMIGSAGQKHEKEHRINGTKKKKDEIESGEKIDSSLGTAD